MKNLIFLSLLLLLCSPALEHVYKGNEPANFHMVSESFYRSAQPNATEMKDLEQMGIRSIINLRMKDSDNRKVAATGLNHIHLPMKAQSVTYEDVVRTMKAIRDAPQPVLIHCRRGSDRTGCMVAFYRIVFLDWSKEKAIEAFLDPKYGYLENLFPNLVELIEQTNIDQLKKDIEL